MASQTLKQAFQTNVDPILQQARMQNGGAYSPVTVYRESGYRQSVAEERPAVSGAGGGIV